MRPRCETCNWVPSLRRRLSGAAGFTLIELLVAIVVLTVGVLSLTTVLASSNRQTTVYEAQQAEIHQGQKELEKIQTYGYAAVALNATPSGTSTDPNNPLYYYNASAATFQWNQAHGQASSASNTDALVVDSTKGMIAPGPTAWTDPAHRLSGNIYRFVTWINDSLCLPNTGCPANHDYKRVTIEVTSATSDSPHKPVLISSIIVDPHALPVTGTPNVVNPLNVSTITCTNGQGVQVACAQNGNQTANQWYLTNAAASGTFAYAPTAANNVCVHYTDVPLQGTVAVPTCRTGSTVTCTLSTPTSCPTPDLLSTAVPSSTQEYNFSPQDARVPASGGRVIQQDVACGATASTYSQDPLKSAFWATAPLSSALNLTGNGAMTLYTQTASATSTSLTLCVAVYDVSDPNGNLPDVLTAVKGSPIGGSIVAFTLAQWPATPTPVSFTFSLLPVGQTYSVPSGHSIGVRVWIANASADAVVQYDGPNVNSTIQLNSQ